MIFALRFIVMRYTTSHRFSGAFLRIVTAMAGAALCYGPASAEPREVGIWYDDTGKGAVKIEICTPTTLCGKIYWLQEPLTSSGEQKIDRYNPEPSMRTRPICGLPVLGNLGQLAEGGFDNGWVYDPKEGKSYSVALDLIGPDKLKVTGYKGMRFLGKSFIWTRAPDDLPSCAANSAEVPGQAGHKVANSKAGKSAANNKAKPKKTANPQHPVASN